VSSPFSLLLTVPKLISQHYESVKGKCKSALSCNVMCSFATRNINSPQLRYKFMSVIKEKYPKEPKPVFVTEILSIKGSSYKCYRAQKG